MMRNRCRTCVSSAPLRRDACPVYGTPPCVATDGTTLIGRVLDGRYELLHVIAAGPRGTVFRAWQRSTDRDVAVKILSAALADHPHEVQRFVQEAKALGRLGSPHVVDLIDLGNTSDGLPYLVMELLHGVTLRELVSAVGPLPVERALRLTLQVLDALQSAHSVGIVHRDIKPENLMVLRGHRERDFVKVLDFGVAHLRESLVPSSEQPMLGTPVSMAPEQVVGEPIDGRADLYALGCVLHFLLTARFPFDDGELRALLHRKLESSPPDLGAVRSLRGYTDALGDLLSVLLARRPSARPGSTGEAMRLVDDALAACSAACASPTSRPGSAASSAMAPEARVRLTERLDRVEQLASAAQAAAREALATSAPLGARAIQAALEQDSAQFRRSLVELRERLADEASAAWDPTTLLTIERTALRLTLVGLSHVEREAASHDAELQPLLARVIDAHGAFAEWLETTAATGDAPGCPYCTLLALDERDYLDDLHTAAELTAPPG